MNARAQEPVEDLGEQLHVQRPLFFDVTADVARLLMAAEIAPDDAMRGLLVRAAMHQALTLIECAANAAVASRPGRDVDAEWGPASQLKRGLRPKRGSPIGHKLTWFAVQHGKTLNLADDVVKIAQEIGYFRHAALQPIERYAVVAELLQDAREKIIDSPGRFSELLPVPRQREHWRQEHVVLVLATTFRFLQFVFRDTLGMDSAQCALVLGASVRRRDSDHAWRLDHGAEMKEILEVLQQAGIPTAFTSWWA